MNSKVRDFFIAFVAVAAILQICAELEAQDEQAVKAVMAANSKAR